MSKLEMFKYQWTCWSGWCSMCVSVWLLAGSVCRSEDPKIQYCIDSL